MKMNCINMYAFGNIHYIKIGDFNLDKSKFIIGLSLKFEVGDEDEVQVTPTKDVVGYFTN